MAKLNAYTTIEALISSILILAVISISITVFTNILAPDKSISAFGAKNALFEFAGSTTETVEGMHNHGDYRIRVTKSVYNHTSDIVQTDLSFLSNDDRVLARLRYLKKKKS